jgi:ribosome recycling factor
MADLSSSKSKMQNSISFLEDEFRKIRAGRANPDMVKDIKVNAYNTSMPLEQLANISVADPRLLTVQPWDKTVVQEVVKALQESDLGINPIVDGNLIRLPLPQLTTEQREEYVKLAKQKTEEARVSIRQKRKDFLLELDKEKSNMSEDEFKRMEKELQEVVDEMNKKIEELSEKKEQELLQI